VKVGFAGGVINVRVSQQKFRYGTKRPMPLIADWRRPFTKRWVQRAPIRKRFSSMVRIRVTYEPSGHADIGSVIPCAKAPPAPTLPEGLAQGVCRVNSLSTDVLRHRPTPPAPTYFIEGLLAHPFVATTSVGVISQCSGCYPNQPRIEPRPEIRWNAVRLGRFLRCCLQEGAGRVDGNQCEKLDRRQRGSLDLGF